MSTITRLTRTITRRRHHAAYQRPADRTATGARRQHDTHVAQAIPPVLLSIR
jgi:hypothetical protein